MTACSTQTGLLCIRSLHPNMLQDENSWLVPITPPDGRGRRSTEQANVPRLLVGGAGLHMHRSRANAFGPRAKRNHSQRFQVAMPLLSTPADPSADTGRSKPACRRRVGRHHAGPRSPLLARCLRFACTSCWWNPAPAAANIGFSAAGPYTPPLSPMGRGPLLPPPGPAPPPSLPPPHREAILALGPGLLGSTGARTPPSAAFANAVSTHGEPMCWYCT